MSYERPAEEPTGWRAEFVRREAIETSAKAVMSVECPWIVPVLAATPTVIYGAPLDGSRPNDPVSVRDAVTCALQVCDALSRLHAVGWLGLDVDLHNVRVTREDGAWRASLVVPHLPAKTRFSYAWLWQWHRDSVLRDLASVAALVRDLVTGYVPKPFVMWGSMGMYERLPWSSLGDARVDAALRALIERPDPEAPWSEPPASVPRDAASLAELLAPLSRDPAWWTERTATMPRARPSEMRRDWDRLIALGEEELSQRQGDGYVILPLARAYHQRACAAFERGDLDAAERDLARCLVLDPWCRYLVTRGALREARGDLRGALASYDEAVSSMRIHGPWLEEELDMEPLREWRSGWGGRRNPAEGARALYARGVTRARLGDRDGALRDLDDARVITSWFTVGTEPPDHEMLALEGLIKRSREALGATRRK